MLKYANKTVWRFLFEFYKFYKFQFRRNAYENHLVNNQVLYEFMSVLYLFSFACFIKSELLSKCITQIRIPNSQLEKVDLN